MSEQEELKHFNTRLIHGMPYENVKSRVKVTEEFWNVVKANLTTVEDVHTWEQICNQNVQPILEDKELTSRAADILPQEPWTEETFNLWMNEVKTKSGKKGKELFHPIRKALTALDNGPELKLLLPLIGREKAYKRLKGEAA